MTDNIYQENGFWLFSQSWDIRYGFLTVTDEHKTRIYRIIKKMKEQEPFSSVSGKFRILLNSLRSTLNNVQNSQPSVMSLEQLCQDIEMLENALHSEQHRYANSAKLSIVGVVLTIAFGIISLITVYVKQ